SWRKRGPTVAALAARTRARSLRPHDRSARRSRPITCKSPRGATDVRALPGGVRVYGPIPGSHGRGRASTRVNHSRGAISGSGNRVRPPLSSAYGPRGPTHDAWLDVTSDDIERRRGFSIPTTTSV